MVEFVCLTKDGTKDGLAGSDARRRTTAKRTTKGATDYTTEPMHSAIWQAGNSESVGETNGSVRRSVPLGAAQCRSISRMHNGRQQRIRRWVLLRAVGGIESLSARAERRRSHVARPREHRYCVGRARSRVRIVMAAVTRRRERARRSDCHLHQHAAMRRARRGAQQTFARRRRGHPRSPLDHRSTCSRSKIRIVDRHRVDARLPAE